MGLFKKAKEKAIAISSMPNRFIQFATLNFESSFRAIKGEDHRKLSKAYKNTAYVCTKKIATQVANVPLRLFMNKPEGKKLLNPTIPINKEFKSYLKAQPNLNKQIIKKNMIVEEVTEHPFITLMANINPYQNYFDFLMLSDINMELMGNTFWYIVKDAFGVPEELWVIPTQWMYVVPDKEKFIKGYVLQIPNSDSGVTRIPFDIDEIVHFKDPSPNNLYYGVSWLGAMSEAYNLQVNIDRYDISFFSNMARPDGVLEAPEGAIVAPSLYEKIKKEFKQRYTGVRNVLTPLVLQGGLQWKQISQAPADLGLKDTRRDSLERIAMASGVPLSKLITENVNKSNAEVAQTDFLRDTIRPRLTLFQEKINEKIMPLYGGEFFVAFDNPIPEDREFQLKQDAMDVRNGIRTVDEIRADRGLSPMAIDISNVDTSKKNSRGLGLEQVKRPDTFDSSKEDIPITPPLINKGMSIDIHKPPLMKSTSIEDDNSKPRELKTFLVTYNSNGILHTEKIMSSSIEDVESLCNMTGKEIAGEQVTVTFQKKTLQKELVLKNGE